MATFKGIIEDQHDYKQYHFEIEAVSKEEAEELIKDQYAEDLDTDADQIEVIVCLEWLTQEQANQYELDNPPPLE